MKKWCLVILALMLCGCSASTKTAETEAVKNDRPVLRTETGSEEKSFTVFAMDTVMQFEIYGGNDEIEEKIRYKHWYFGHFHRDIELDEKHTGVYHRLLPLR